MKSWAKAEEKGMALVNNRKHSFGFIIFAVLLVIGIIVLIARSQHPDLFTSNKASATQAAPAAPTQAQAATPQAVNDADIATLKPFIHGIVEREDAINMATNQLGQDLQNLAAPNTPKKTQALLKADMADQITAINSMATDVNALTAPHLQKAEIEKLAQNVLELHKKWTQAAQGRINAFMQNQFGDADKIRTDGEVIAKEEAGALFQLSSALNVALIDLAK
jgi:hypothetical protein